MAAMETKMERAKNTASAKDIAKVLRGASLNVLPDPSSYMLADIEKVISNFEDFLADLCEVTPRPTVPFLQSGFALVFKGVSKSDCRAFAEQVVEGCWRMQGQGQEQHIREKAALQHLSHQPGTERSRTSEQQEEIHSFL